MRSLVALIAGVGTVSGLIVGVLAHRTAEHAFGGWTLYAPLASVRHYPDYISGAGVGWFPGILEYAALGLAGGLVLGAVLAMLRFRLVRG